MQVYPKIETVFKRDLTTFKVTNEIRCEEFKNIKTWLVTEKIDGRNQRIVYDGNLHAGGGIHALTFKGRTEKADMPEYIMEPLTKLFPIDKFQESFEKDAQVCLYGEMYGPKINKGGIYRDDISFRLIDVWINGWWLKWGDVVVIAQALKIETVPVIGCCGLDTAVSFVTPTFVSATASDNEKQALAEGIVATAYPLVLFRNGNPLKFKLKRKDFSES